MIFPFRSSTIFRNRWVALLWAAGICFMASEIVDSVSGVTRKADEKAAARSAATPGRDAPPPPALDRNAPVDEIVR